ncbi:histidine kinase dimerization/phosphoacceptor domain -containing protein [Methanosarcina sp. Mfa9]|uniref:histidine kinase dimerization/phosphoacceptor domain -containing protein n=1 Tax=Methanosarcina sp. Mfa9 TaxID=3439063 RepID=UPI003F86C5C7
MRFKDVPLKTKLILYIVIGVLLVLAASMGVIISTVTSQEEKLAYQQSVEMSANYANKFDADMKANFAIAKTISNTMDSYEASDREEVLGILKNLLIENPDLLGTYVAYEPNAFDGKDAEFVNGSGHDSTGRFVPYWNKMSGPIVLDPLLHYEHSDYYQLPKETKGDLLTEPYYYEGVFMMSYVSPIFKDGEFVGIGGVDVSLEYVDEVVSEVRTFDTGYAFMVSNTGTFLSHPTHKDWIGEKGLHDFGGGDLEKASKDIKNGVGGHLETTDPTTGKTVVMFYEPVETGNSAFVLVIPKEEMLAGVTALRNRLLIISAVSILFMAALAWMIARSITRPIDEIVEGFSCIADDAVKGKLNSRADTDVEVDFREIPRGLNKILDAVIVPIRETMRVTNALAEGELKERVNLDVEGEFRELGDTLDKFSETLNTIIDDSNAVLTAFQDNDFKHPVRVHGQGDFKLLTDGIEEARRSLGRATAERREAEKALLAYAMELEQSNKLKEDMERVVNNSPVVAFLWKYEDKWPAEFVSKNVTRFGYEVEDFTSQRVLYGDIIHPDDLKMVKSELERNVESGSDAYSLEYRIFTKSGELRWVDERTFVQRDLKGGVHLQGVILDITEHKKAEDALLLIEEVRKKEIHHRIKNNLQVISTLLYLESGNFEDEKVIGAFKDSQHRVKSMALVHEKLYQSEDMVSVDFADYIRNLTNYLFQSYSIRNGNISLKLDVDRIFLGMDTAVPLGIIINELVSNSLKHAFAEKDSGEINISLKRDENRTAENPEEYFLLDVRDSGVGFPEDLDFRDTDSLGLQLVVSLVDQIEGEIRLDTSKGGTEFFIWFKELKYRTKL